MSNQSSSKPKSSIKRVAQANQAQLTQSSALSLTSALSNGLISDPSLPALSVREQFNNKHIFVTGVTGFVGKVLLTMIIDTLPNIRKISVLIRRNKTFGGSKERFMHQVMTSEPLKAMAKKWGNEYLQQWVQDKIVPITGDVTQERMGMSEEDYQNLTKNDPLDLILHCAGNVNFDPPLNEALEVNTLGVSHKIDLASDANCPLVHMSTCFVIGEYSGQVPESSKIIGTCPKNVDFDVEREVQDAVNLIQRWRDYADSQVMQESFRAEAIKVLEKKNLDPTGDYYLTQEIKQQRKRWLNKKLSTEGMERAKHWGWTNTYTYTKGMGERLTLVKAKEKGVKVAIVRPAIVESSYDFPFPGWNEGINTCAPIVYLYWKGQRFTPSNPDNILDLIPVDWVCRGTLLAAAEVLEDRCAKTVYQFCSGGDHPLYMRRAIELTNLAWRPRYDDDFSFMARHILRNFDTIPVSPALYRTVGAPRVKKVAQLAQGLIKALPKPAKNILNPVNKGLRALEKGAEVADTIFSIFAPFILDNNPKFLAEHTQAASARLVKEEKELFNFSIKQIDWRYYWKDVHMAGLQKWVFDELDTKLKRTREMPRERDLVTLFHRTCQDYKYQKALQFFTENGLEVTYTYGDVWQAALRVANSLKSKGMVVGDVMLLMSPNEPAWPMAYIGGILADLTVVPVDPEMSYDEVARIVTKSQAKIIVHHEEFPYTSDHLSLPQDYNLLSMTLGASFQAEPLDETLLSLHDRSQQIASLLFTSGTTGDPKGVMLSHENFCSLLANLHGVFKVGRKDRFLSVLPLFHTFEFSTGFLMPFSVGAQVTYLSDLEGSLLRTAMKSIKPTGIIGIPALWDILEKRIHTQVSDKGKAAKILFDASLRLNRTLRTYGLNIGPLAFNQIHQNLGGKVRYLISGGAALNNNVLEVFEGLGFDLLEGYGLTEAAPVLSVRRPGSRKGAGSVGRPLPGVKIKIKDPNTEGVGQVIAQADHVMSGYLNQPEATAEVIKEGWLHTGDLGKIDRHGHLVLSGRSKEMIVTSSGKNVYPDELEPIYVAHDYIDEISIVGIPDPQGDERVAALIVLVDEAPQDAAQAVKIHINTLNALRPDHQKLRTFRFWPSALPRTATRKIKRSVVRSELIHLLKIGKEARKAEHQNTQYQPSWLYAAFVSLCAIDVHELNPSTQLMTDLGLSSLQLVELRLMIEDKLGYSIDGDQLAKAESIADIAAICQSKQLIDHSNKVIEEPVPLWQDLPEPLRDLGKKAIDMGRGIAYNSLFKIKVKGQENIPFNQQAIVIANHSSHLDIGLIKEALGSYGDDVCVLAAQDYFFDSQEKEAIFSQFTRLIPIDRTASLERSLAPAEAAVRKGHSILMYPEGTRSIKGDLQEFKMGIGYLQRKTGLPILPLYIKGTHKAMPKGKVIPKVGRTLSVHIGPLIDTDEIKNYGKGTRRHERYQEITQMCYEAIQALQNASPYPWNQEETTALVNGHIQGAYPLFNYLENRFDQSRVKQPITWYFSLGESADGKWTLSVDQQHIRFYAGRPQEGQADCVLKTDLRIFERMVKEGYIPSFAEFAEGKVKTNNPSHLRSFQSIFAL
jgi:long-chain acyl-CoA synthetase